MPPLPHIAHMIRAIAPDVARARRIHTNCTALFEALERLIAEWDDEEAGASPTCPDCALVPGPYAPDAKPCAYHQAVRLLVKIRGE